MAFKLRPGKPEDVPEFVKIFFDGFSNHPITARVFRPGTKEAMDFWQNSLASEIKDTNARFLAIEDISTTPPTMAAFAKWNRVEASDNPPAELPNNWPSNGDTDLAKRFFGELGAKHAEIMGGREHWYLELIATRADYQRRGLGVMLVQWGIDRADEEGWECYLDSTPEGKRLYHKLGFATVCTTEYPDISYRHEFMVREKRKQ